MTLRLRAIHRHIWFVWALLLPLMWVAALRSIPGPLQGDPFGASFGASLPAALPVIRGQKETADFLISLRSDSAFKEVQLEVLIKTPISTPALNVYWNNGSIGVLSSQGLYRFAVDSIAGHGSLQFRDEVRGQTIIDLNFPPTSK